MLDVGCSYGIGSAFVKFGCSFDEMVAFFSSRAPQEYRAACEAMRSRLVAPGYYYRPHKLLLEQVDRPSLGEVERAALAQPEWFQPDWPRSEHRRPARWHRRRWARCGGCRRGWRRWGL